MTPPNSPASPPAVTIIRERTPWWLRALLGVLLAHAGVQMVAHVPAAAAALPPAVAVELTEVAHSAVPPGLPAELAHLVEQQLAGKSSSMINWTISIDTSASGNTLLDATPAQSGGCYVSAFNMTTTPIYCGGSNVTTTNGWPICSDAAVCPLTWMTYTGTIDTFTCVTSSGSATLKGIVFKGC